MYERGSVGSIKRTGSPGASSIWRKLNCLNPRVERGQLNRVRTMVTLTLSWIEERLVAVFYLHPRDVS